MASFGTARRETLPAEPAPETLHASRAKSLLYLVGSIALALMSAISISHPASARALLYGWLGVVFFGLGVVVFSWMQIRPHALRLDAAGFTLTGGLIRRPRAIAWSDVDSFFVIKLPRGGKMPAFTYVKGRAPSSPLTRIAGTLGTQGGLPKGWDLSPEDLVDKLEAWRRRATSTG